MLQAVVDDVRMNASLPKEDKSFQNICRFLLDQLPNMPRSAPTPCRYPGCAAVLATPGFCPQHQASTHRDYGRARRGFDAEVGFYQSKDWRVLRAAVLRDGPLCVLSNANRLARRIAKKGSLGANEIDLITQAFGLENRQVSAWAQQQTQPLEEDALSASLVQLGMNP